MRKIVLCGGKYTIINDLNNGGEFKALLYGKEWRNLSGDNLILALFQELEEASDNEAKMNQIIRRLVQQVEMLQNQLEFAEQEIERFRVFIEKIAEHDMFPANPFKAEAKQILKNTKYPGIL